VHFSKKECNIFDSSGKWLMGGKRTADNCYGLSGLTTDPQIFCNKPTIDNSELWHQRLGHLNFSDMLKIAGKGIVEGLTKMEKTEKGVCGACQLGKQTRAAHKKTSGIHTSRNLELLHMDLMGPTRTASLGGKRYILVIVDDFSRYTWAIPIREIMEESSKIPSLKNSVSLMESSRNFLLLSLLSRMELLKGRTR
jgi:hypothetical protein